jgi:hypothetical protein
MIAATMAIICLIFYGVSNACDPTLSGMTFNSPYVYYMPGGSDFKITHTVATGNVCHCGTIEYVWSKTAGTSGNLGTGYTYFLSYYTRTENYIPIG